MPLGPIWDHESVPKLERPTEGPASWGPSTALEGTSTMVIPYGGMQPDDLRIWHENFAPYENLASNKDVAERAFRYVRENVQQYDQKTIRLQRKWQLLNFLLQGNSLTTSEDPENPHSPLLYQLVEQLEARITNAVLGTGTGSHEWFAVKGREPMDEREELAIQAWLDYQLDKNRWRSKVSEIVRTMLIHAFAPVKTTWQHKVERVVERTRERKPTRNGIRTTTIRREVEKIVHSGAQIELIDPFWFMGDTTRTDPQEMLWCGERSRVVEDDAIKLEEQGHYLNTSELRDQEPQTWFHSYSDWTRQSRSQAYPYDFLDAGKRPEGSPKVFIREEIWGMFDAFGTGRARPFVITVINGQTVVQVRENPFDDKHKPYAIARACKYPFELHTVGPLDHAIQLSLEIDIHRMLGIQASRNAMCPLVFVDSKENLPDSLWGIAPGSVFEVPPNSIKFAEMQSPIQHMKNTESVLRQDAEMTVGSPREFAGMEGGAGTATEYQGRIREANMRVRTYVRSMADMCEQMLRQMHALSAQFLTTDTRFRVLGAHGKRASSYAEVGPQTFDPVVDFDFLALTNLHIAGMEATNLKDFFSTIMPLVAGNPGILNSPLLIQRFGKLLIGSAIDGLVHVPEDPRDLLSQDEELVMLLAGDRVPVHEGDDDEAHLMVLGWYMGTEDFRDKPPPVRDAIEEHAFRHEQQRGHKEAMRRAQEQMMQPFGQAVTGFEGQGSPMTNLARNAMAQGGGGAAPGQREGETPGPPAADRMANPGRMGTPFQAEADSQGPR